MLNIRSKDEILRKIEETRDDALTAPAAYVLITYLKWADVPEKYKELYREKAAEIKNIDLEEFWDEEEITKLSWESHIQQQIMQILQEIAKGNLTVALGIIPTIIANLWVAKINTKHIENMYMTIVQTFTDYVNLNRPEAEIDAIITIADLLNQVVKKARINLGVNINNFTKGYIKHQYAYDERTDSFLYRNLVQTDIGEEAEKGDDIGEN